MAPFSLNFRHLSSTKRMGAMVVVPLHRTIIARAIQRNHLFDDGTGKNPSVDDYLAEEDTVSNKFTPFTSPSTLHAPVQIAAVGGDGGLVTPSASLSEAAAAIPTAPPITGLDNSIRISPVAIVSAVLGFFAVVSALAVMIISKTAWYRKRKSAADSQSNKAGKRASKRKVLITQRKTFEILSKDSDAKENTGSMQLTAEDRGSAVPTLYYYAIGTDAGDEDIADTLKYESTVGSMVSITYEAGLGKGAEGSQDSHGATASEETHSSAQTGATHISLGFYSIASTRTSMTSVMSTVSLKDDAEEEEGQVQQARAQSMEIKRAVLVNLSALIA